MDWDVGSGIRLAHGILPVEAVGEASALQIVAAGEAQELGVHGVHHRHQVGAQTVGAVVESGREEFDMCQTVFSRLWKRYTETDVLGLFRFFTY